MWSCTLSGSLVFMHTFLNTLNHTDISHHLTLRIDFLKKMPDALVCCHRLCARLGPPWSWWWMAWAKRFVSCNCRWTGHWGSNFGKIYHKHPLALYICLWFKMVSDMSCKECCKLSKQNQRSDKVDGSLRLEILSFQRIYGMLGAHLSSPRWIHGIHGEKTMLTLAPSRSPHPRSKVVVARWWS